MAITHSGLAQDMVRDLVRAAPPEAGVRRVWVWSEHGYVDPQRDYVELSVLQDAPDDETKHRLLTALVDTLDERYPEANKFLHMFSTAELDGLDPEGELRPGSEEVDVSGG